jgi:membrane fusion protein
VTLLFTAITATVVIFLALFSYTRTARVAGVVVPAAGLIRVSSTQSGVVADKRVIEGQAVKAGDVLFVLNSERANAGSQVAEQAIATSLQARRDSLASEQTQVQVQYLKRTAAAVRKRDELTAELSHFDRQIELQQRRVALAEASVARFANLQIEKFVSAVQVQEKEADLLDQRQRLADLLRGRGASERDLISTNAEINDLQIQMGRDIEALRRNVQTLDQDMAENDARRQIAVRAPQDGVVAAIAAELGQSVPGGQTVATILPAGTELEAELYVPSRAAGFLKPGTQVYLSYQAFPYQKFGRSHGVVRSVSRTAIRPEDIALNGAYAPGGGSEPLYRARVKLDRQSVTAYGTEHRLQSGGALEASIVLETRRLYEWVLEPLYTITGRI